MTGSTPPENASRPTSALLLAAFEGWNDAGGCATQAVAMIAEEWGAEVVHRVDPEQYHDFQVTRPLVSRDGDGAQQLEWPETTISVATSPVHGRRLIVVEGIEPSFRWRSYCAEILKVARELDVGTVAGVGALLADVPHSRPIPVHVSSDDELVCALLNVERSDYEGPTGITGVLTHEAALAGMHTLGVWTTVPHYVAQPPAPKSTLALLRALEPVLGEPVPIGDLAEDARAWQTGVDELAASDPEIAEYVAQLEEVKDTAELPEASGEAIAQEFESYLRHRGDDGPSQEGGSGRARPPRR